MSKAIKLRHGARSDVGLVRRGNEDSFVAAPPLFAVCDGMGGALAGEVASALAAEALEEMIGGGAELREAAERANAVVYERAQRDKSHAGMGTTLTAMLVEGSTAQFVHVGDSRAYLFREGELSQITADHSMVAELVRAGKISAAEAEQHPHRSVLTRALGTDDTIDLDEYSVDLEVGDTLLLCSDGLTGPVKPSALARCLTKSDPDEAAAELIAEARHRGGPDNITAVVVRVDADPSGDTVAADLGETEEVEPAADDGFWPGDEKPQSRRPAAKRGLKVAAALLAIVAIIAAAAAVTLSSVFFVGRHDSQLAVYSGLPVRVGPVPLHVVYRSSTRPYSSLDDTQKSTVDARQLSRRATAMELARQLGMWQ